MGRRKKQDGTEELSKVIAFTILAIIFVIPALIKGLIWLIKGIIKGIVFIVNLFKKPKQNNVTMNPSYNNNKPPKQPNTKTITYEVPETPVDSIRAI